MPRLACKVDLEPHMPLLLKGILMDYGIKQTEYAAAIIQTESYVEGRPLSLSAAADLVVRNIWPKLTPRAEVVRQTDEFLRGRGVPESLIETAFEFDPDDSHKFQQPRGIHVGKHSRKAPLIDIKEVENEMLSPQAKKQFSLFRDPFDNDVQCPEDVFMSHDQRDIREHMFAVAKHGGLLAVIGESGSGKTTLFNDLMERINVHAEPIIVCTPSVIDVDLRNLKTRLTARRIMEALVAQLTDERPCQSIEKLTTQVRNALSATTAPTGQKKTSVVVVIEEAHSLLPGTLKVLKRLVELKDGLRTLLGVILIAQPEMGHLLNESRHPELREFINRCTRVTLMPLDNVVEDYLRLKFKRIGANYDTIFAPDAAAAIQQLLTGRDRRTNTTVSMVYPLAVNLRVVHALNEAAQYGQTRIDAKFIGEMK